MFQINNYVITVTELSV